MLGIAHQVAEDLCPELTIAGPADPIARPFALGVARERGRLAQPEPPAGQKGIAALGQKRDVGGGLRRRDDITKEKWGILPVDAPQHLVIAENLGKEWFL